MSRSRTGARAAVLAIVVPVATAGLLLGGGPAGAVPVEGDADPTGSLQVVRLSSTSAAGSTLLVSHGYAAVLAPRMAV